jgi:hypothetical protein
MLVPQGGFEPSTYRLRSDCSAVELLRLAERALYLSKKPPLVEEARSALSPFVPAPAFAGVNSSGDPESVNTFLRSSRESGDPDLELDEGLDSRFRGNERWKVLGSVA